MRDLGVICYNHMLKADPDRTGSSELFKSSCKLHEGWRVSSHVGVPPDLLTSTE